MSDIRITGILKIKRNITHSYDAFMILCRFFPNVEKNVKEKLSTKYIPILSKRDLPSAILEALCLSESTSMFVESRDSCSSVDQKPLFALKTTHGNLFPLIIIEKAGHVFWALMEPPIPPAKHTDCIYMSSISQVYMLLEKLSEFVGNLNNDVTEGSQQMADALMYLSMACPFGRPICTEKELISEMFKSTARNVPSKSKSATSSLPTALTPVWRAGVGAGSSSKTQVSVSVSEQLYFSQHDSPSYHPSLNVTGTVTVRAQLPAQAGAAPRLSLTLATLSPVHQFDRVLTSPFTQSFSGYRPGVPSSSMKICCIPPLERSFAALTYSVSVTQNVEAPFLCVYHLRFDGGVANVSLWLRVATWFRHASCEHCSVRLPLPRASRSLDNMHVTCGVSVLSSDKSTLVWTLPPHYPRSGGSSAKEEMLTASLKLERSSSVSQLADPLCGQENNSFARVFFKATDVTFSDASVDPKSVLCAELPPGKLKVAVSRDMQASDYKIWNTFGDAPTVFNPTESMLKMATDQ